MNRATAGRRLPPHGPVLPAPYGAHVAVTRTCPAVVTEVRAGACEGRAPAGDRQL